MTATSTLTDIELVDLLKGDDEDALATMYQKYWEPLFRSAFSLLRDRPACEDLIQEVFINIWDHRKTLEISLSLKSYLYAAMRYAVYRQIRSGKGREDIFDAIVERLQTPAAYGQLEHREMLAQINAIVATLPEKCREVYQLSRDERLSHKEIASRLGISTKTVENQIAKALRHLRASLGNILTLEMMVYILRK
jgi:RNA polymerase sigma-70 factor (family 1)